ncbi:MAG: NlpC/P60 family protein [Thermoplasmata archaeon]
MTLLELSKDKKELIKAISDILLGLPYKLGAEVDLKKKPEELKKERAYFDCSELVEYIFYQIGYKIPDGSYNQYDASYPVSINTIEIGDLVFKRDIDTRKICHSGIIVDEGLQPVVLEAEGWYGKVLKRSLQSFMKPSSKTEYAGVRRLILERIKVL